ncbi:MAG: AbrB/MazE/SpoVT family DNA-binding domain-containing protein [Nanoarchaeota archaeon]
MKRSIIKHGPATLIVSLPSKWAKERDLKPGSEVDVQPQGNRLIISTGEVLSALELNLDVTGLSPFMITRLLARSYQKGYDVINLRYADRKSLNAIREKVTELLGFDIIEEDKNVCTIRAIATTLNIDFDIALRRVFFRILESSRTCQKAFNEQDSESLSDIWESDLEVNKMTYFCLRTLAKGVVSGYDIFVLYHLIETLEDLGDEIKKLAMELSKTKSKNMWVSKKLKTMVELTELIVQFFYSPKKEAAVKAFELVNELSSLEDLPKNINKEFLQSVIHFHRIADFLYLYVGMRLDTISELHAPTSKA